MVQNNLTQSNRKSIKLYVDTRFAYLPCCVTPMFFRLTSIISRDATNGALQFAGRIQRIATGLYQSSTSTHPLKNDDRLPASPPQQPTAPTASGVVLHTVFDEAGRPEETHPLLQYRAAYPEGIWTKIHQATPPSTQRPLAVDLGIGTGRGAIELAKRGFRVIGIESSSNLMASTHHSAAAAGVAVDLIPATLEVALLYRFAVSMADASTLNTPPQGQLLPAHTADVVTVLHGLHLVPTAAALTEAHRLLRPQGLLVAAWNDRDQSSPFIQELETLMEGFNADYSRHNKQRDLVWLVGPQCMSGFMCGGFMCGVMRLHVQVHTMHYAGALGTRVAAGANVSVAGVLCAPQPAATSWGSTAARHTRLPDVYATLSPAKCRTQGAACACDRPRAAVRWGVVEACLIEAWVVGPTGILARGSLRCRWRQSCFCCGGKMGTMGGLLQVLSCQKNQCPWLYHNVHEFA